jgi:tRNA-specific 2-thiouridylase
MHYTIGKRKGFEVRGAHEPHYVIKIKPKENEIVVGLKDELDINSFEIKDINMFIDKKEFECSVKIRYRSAKTPCRVKVEGSCARVELKEPVQGLAAGQMAVFYDGQKVIGGGWIE